MAGEEDFLSRLAAVLASFDEIALEALASKGLLRRAQKDLEQGAVMKVEEPSEESIRVHVGKAIVAMPAEGPTAARCTCPASSSCRHVLAATLHLQRWLADRAPGKAASDPVAAARRELLALSLNTLREWAGARAVREGLRLVAEGLPLEVQEQNGLVLYLPSVNVECRFIAGTGLDGVLTNGPRKDRAKFIVAAILAFQKTQGHQFDEPAELRSGPAEAEGAPRSRLEIAAAACALCEEMVRIGLAHLSPSVEERLATLALSATGANLPRLASGLRGLADDVAHLVARNVQADLERLFEGLARVYALAAVLARPTADFPPELIGQQRTRYDAVGQLDLAGVGAYAWRTRTGYSGLTVLFWDERGHQWFTWSDSRPRLTSSRFEPTQRYKQGGPWMETTPQELSRRRCRLVGARKNAQNRLSSTQQCRAFIGEATHPNQLAFNGRLFTQWAALHEYAASVYGVGLQEFRMTDHLVVLRPTHWGMKAFDRIEQVFRWQLVDSDGASLLAILRFDEVTSQAIEALEQLNPATSGAWGLVAQLQFDTAGLVMTPLVLFRRADSGQSAIHNLNLDNDASNPQPTEASLAAKGMDSDADDTPEPQLLPLPLGLERALAGLEEELQHHAECGCHAMVAGAKERLAEQARRVRRHGLDILAETTERLSGNEPAGTLLRLRYLCLVHRQAAVRLLVAHPS
jgi:hypothetical protein